MPTSMAKGTDGTYHIGQLAGSLIRVAPDGTRETIITAVRMPTGMAIGPGGAIYVTQYDSAKCSASRRNAPDGLAGARAIHE
jgi:sugar lactone lactonase YvrE